MKGYSENNAKKGSGGGLLFSMLFPYFELLIVAFRAVPLFNFFEANKMMTEAKWMRAAIKRHLITALVVFIVNAAAVAFLTVETKSMSFQKGRSAFSFKSLLKTKTMNPKINQIVSHPVSLFFIAQGVFGLLLIATHPLIVNKRRLRNILVSNGFDSSIASQAVWTPFGVYLNITGKSAVEVASNKAMWDMLNMNVTKDSLLVNASARTRVFFKNNFELAPTYNFEAEAEKLFKG